MVYIPIIGTGTSFITGTLHFFLPSTNSCLWNVATYHATVLTAGEGLILGMALGHMIPQPQPTQKLPPAHLTYQFDAPLVSRLHVPLHIIGAGERFAAQITHVAQHAFVHRPNVDAQHAVIRHNFPTFRTRIGARRRVVYPHVFVQRMAVLETLSARVTRHAFCLRLVEQPYVTLQRAL